MTNASPKKKEFYPIITILAYCLILVAIRLLFPQSLLPDEAEQIFDASVYSLGYDKHPPLYSWLVKTTSYITGLNVYALTIVKYTVLFFFYTSFYFVCRKFWNHLNSLLITCSLLIFPTYVYRFSHDVTHTILATMMGSITLLVFINVLEKKTLKNYILLGLCFGLGILSKYNYAFIPAGIVLASLTTQIGRKTIFNKKSIVAALITLSLILPHLIWAINNKFHSVIYAIDKANVDKSFKFFTKILGPFVGYWEIFVFALIIILVFCPSFNFIKNAFLDKSSKEEDNTNKSEILITLRWTALYCLITPLIVIFVFQIDNFFSRWMAPVFFIAALALFSFLFNPLKEDDTYNIPYLSFRKTLLVTISTSICLVLMSAKLITRFFPELIGGKSKVLVPFDKISKQLLSELKTKQIDLYSDTIIKVPSKYYGGNLKMYLPEAEIILFRKLTAQERKKFKKKNKILVLTQKHKDKMKNKKNLTFSALTAKYLGSKEEYKLWLGIRRKK